MIPKYQLSHTSSSSSRSTDRHQTVGIGLFYPVVSPHPFPFFFFFNGAFSFGPLHAAVVSDWCHLAKPTNIWDLNHSRCQKAACSAPRARAKALEGFSCLGTFSLLDQSKQASVLVRCCVLVTTFYYCGEHEQLALGWLFFPSPVSGVWNSVQISCLPGGFALIFSVPFGFFIFNFA